ncbi:MAG TPA: hypothetical protein VFX65_11575 [Candidatus Limnocylindrales bacterium]|nr:hypothetical protein [Candidatus Limnocylindrales bacterium]
MPTTPPAATAAPTPVPATPPPNATAAPPASTPAAAPVGTAAAPGGPAAGSPTGSIDPLAPIIVRGAGGSGTDAGSGGGSGAASSTSGFGLVANLGAPIAYAAGVVLVALVIARRRLERQERAERRAVTTDPDRMPGRRAEPTERPSVPDDEANLPRWLRPSLRAERFGMDLSRSRVLPAGLPLVPPTRTPMSFGRPPDDRADRRVIVAPRFGLLRVPDDVEGRAVVELERGDEVEILESDGQWTNVLTPTGHAGWLPTTALGAALDAAAEPVTPSRAAGPAAPDGAVAADKPLDLAAILAAGRPRSETGA